MDSSPSSSHLDASNSVDKGAETMEIDGQANPSSTPPPSLLDLPDELLSTIYDDVFHSLYESLTPYSAGTPFPLSYIFVNKRIFRVAQPVWFQHLTLPSEAGDETLANLLDHSEVHQHVRSIDLDIHLEMPALQMTTLSSFINVTHLALHFNTLEHVKMRVTEVLKRLRKLQHLAIFGYPQHFEDASFSIDTSIPSLRSLETSGATFLRDLLKAGASAIHCFTTQCEDPVEEYPWAGMQRLILAPQEGVIEDKEDFVAMFSRALGSADPPALRHLVFGFDAFAAPHDDPSFFAYDDLRRCLEQLRFFPLLQRLDFGKISEKFRWEDQPQLRLFAIKTVSLSGALKVYHSLHLTSLHSFLSTFPCLSSLLIEGFRFTHEALCADSLTDLSPTFVALKCPVLAAFLLLLRPSCVLEFRFRAMGEKRQMRWRRASREEDFESDCWTIG